MFTLIRFIAIASVIALRVALPRTYTSLFIGVLFGHYALSVWYARRKLKVVVTMQVHPGGLLFLVAASVLLPVVAVPSLALYFCYHHALTEGYMVATRRGGPPPADAPSRRLLHVRMGLAAAVYAFVLCRDHAFWRVPHQVWMALVGVAAAAFVVVLVPALPALKRGEAADLVGFELVGVGASALTLFVPITFWDVIFYHLLVWIFLPLRTLPGAAAKGKFLGQTALVSTLFFCLTPAVNLFPSLTGGFWLRQSEIWGYFHITLSFAVSSFNPRWISRWFAPRPLVVAARA